MLRKIAFFLIAIVIGLFVVFSGIYRGGFSVSGYEKNLLWARREVYRRELGFFGRNEITNKTLETTKFYLDKTTRKIAQPFDLNRYFSTDDQSFYHFIFFPFVILGLLYLLSNNIGIVIYYLGIATAASIFLQPNSTFYLFLPFVNLTILIGILNIKKLLIRK